MTPDDINNIYRAAVDSGGDPTRVVGEIIAGMMPEGSSFNASHRTDQVEYTLNFSLPKGGGGDNEEQYRMSLGTAMNDLRHGLDEIQTIQVNRAYIDRVKSDRVDISIQITQYDRPLPKHKHGMDP